MHPEELHLYGHDQARCCATRTTGFPPAETGPWCGARPSLLPVEADVPADTFAVARHAGAAHAQEQKGSGL